MKAVEWKDLCCEGKITPVTGSRTKNSEIQPVLRSSTEAHPIQTIDKSRAQATWGSDSESAESETNDASEIEKSDLHLLIQNTTYLLNPRKITHRGDFPR